MVISPRLPANTKNDYIELVVNDANTQFGVEGKKMTRTKKNPLPLHSSPSLVDVEWAWAARDGQVLVWNLMMSADQRKRMSDAVICRMNGGTQRGNIEF
jgi:hypothetical protein